MKHGIVSLVMCVLGACGGAQTPQVQMVPEARALWEPCHAEVERWCHDHSHGSASHERECMTQEQARYAALGDDAARRAYLSSHGCTAR